MHKFRELACLMGYLASSAPTATEDVVANTSVACPSAGRVLGDL
jgi:hypothetical protein